MRRLRGVRRLRAPFGERTVYGDEDDLVRHPSCSEEAIAAVGCLLAPCRRLIGSAS
jgi:hypothetical protein